MQEDNIGLNGLFWFSSYSQRVYPISHKHLWSNLMEYLGLGADEKYCHLKGFFLKRKEDYVGKGAAFEGTWFSGSPCSARITRYFEFYNCNFSVLSRNGKIDRIYKYQIVPINKDLTELHIEIVQTYDLSPLLIFNPGFIQRIINETFKRLLPYGLYEEINLLLPRLFNRTIANDAVPFGYLPHKYKWKVLEWINELIE